MAVGSKHVLIIGAGVIGLCAAYYAIQQGHRVTIVERGGPDHDCCSLGNAGMIVPSHFVPLAAPGMVGLGLRMLLDPEGPFAIRPCAHRGLVDWGWRFVRAANAAHVERSATLLRDLNLRSRRLFEELANEWNDDLGLTRRGLLMLCKTERTLQDETHLAEGARRLGLSAEVLTPEETARLEPGARMDIAGAVYFPQDCHLDPARFMAGLTRALTSHGATFCWCTEVTGWQFNGNSVNAVQTSRGDLEADEFVLAGGAWSGRVAQDLGLFVPLQAGKGYSVTLPAPRQCPSICAILTEARVAVTPMDGALRFAGTMEIGGLDTAINPRRVAGMLKSIPRYLPDFELDDFAALPVWAGLRPCSPDGLPYIGRPRRYANLVIATGHAMMGVSLGPVTGELVAQLISGVPPSLAIEALLRPDRYEKTRP